MHPKLSDGESFVTGGPLRQTRRTSDETASIPESGEALTAMGCKTQGASERKHWRSVP